MKTQDDLPKALFKGKTVFVTGGGSASISASPRTSPRSAPALASAAKQERLDGAAE